ncbi:MAG: glycoside hydrolase family 88 protein [Reichenbachiella sp.]
MNRAKYYSVLLVLLVVITQCQPTNQNNSSSEVVSKKSWYTWMVDSEISRNPDPRLLDFQDAPKWEYTPGLVCSAVFDVYEKTGDEKYLNYVRFYLDSMIREDGSIKTYERSDFNIDRINSGKVLFDLYSVDKKDKYRKALDTLRSQMEDHPRTSEGGFWHKKRYPYQMWLDGLYMASPFLAQYGDDLDEPALFDDVANQIYLIDKYAYDSEKQLYYHGWDESRDQKWANNETGLSPHFWGRAMGWFAMALVDVLDYMPEDHPKREGIITTLNKVAEGIVKYQDPKTGLWWQVLDRGGDKGNYLETSCSSMFSYSLMKGVKNGYLPSKYLPFGKKAFEGITDNYIVINSDNTISLTNICGVAGLGGNPYRDASYEYYVGEEIRSNDPKGVGPFIMAALVYEAMEVN